MGSEAALLVGGRRLPPRPPTPPSITKNYLEAELYCFLCRTELPWSKSPDLFPLSCSHEHAAWETDVICLFDLITDDGSPDVCAYKTNLNVRNFFTGGPLGLRDGKGRTQYVSYIWRGRIKPREGRPIVLTHVACWKMIRKFFPGVSFARLYNLALRLMHLLPEECPVLSTPIDAVTFHQPFPLETESESGRLLARCAQLPVELQRQVLLNLPPSILPSLLISSYVAQAYLPLLSDGSKLDPEVVSIPLMGYGGASSIKVRSSTVDILGLAYLSGLRVTEDDGVEESTAHCISVRTGEVSAVRFVLGTHGVSGLRFCYRDGSASPWLGELGHGWHGIVRSNRDGPLYVLHDGLKILRVDFEDIKSDGGEPSRAVWNTNPELIQECDIKIMDRSLYLAKIPLYPSWRIFRYVPLHDGPVYATGITGYVNEYGVNKLIVHGKIPRHFGSYGPPSPSSVARHLALMPGECIKYVWLQTFWPLHPSRFQFSILVVTTQGRYAYFAPERQLHHPQIVWTCLTPKSKGFVTGLVYDIGQKGDVSLSSFGVTISYLDATTGSAAPPNLPQFYTTGEASEFLQTHDDGLMTTAKLYNIARIFFRMVGGLVKGMIIHYHDGSADALGRWDPSLTDGVVELYDHTQHGVLHTLRFYQTGTQLHRHKCSIRMITINEDIDDQRWGFFKVEPGNRLVWEYTTQYDHVREWTLQTTAIAEVASDNVVKTIRV